MVFADADEFLTYDRCDDYPLPVLIERLRAFGETKLLAPLVDAYSEPASPDELLFDALPENSYRTGGGPHITGGPRSRMAAATGASQVPLS